METQARAVAVPEGWPVGPPDFVGVGAQRAGTSWWYQLIAAHPDVSFHRGVHVKETHFFDDLQDVEELDAALVERYHRCFPRAPGTLVGEWTPRYMLDSWTPRQIASAAPDARILILLRDPVDRYASGFARSLRLARERGETPSEARIDLDQTARGLYNDQVRRVLHAFPREHVLILQYERCRVELEPELHRTHDFLGLAPGFLPVGERNLPREPRERSTARSERERLARVFAPDVRALLEVAPEIDPDLWPSVRDLL
jgi:hypothetical protein